MRGLPEYRIRAADSISPPLASGSASGSVSTRILPSALGPRGPPGPWILDAGSWNLWAVGVRGGLWALWRAQAPLESGSWNLWAVGLGVCAGPWILYAGICGQCGPVWAARILYSGFWKLGCQMDGGVWAAQILYSVFWKLGCRREGRRVWAARILYSGFWKLGPCAFCILHSVFCQRHVHVMHMHGSRDGT